MWCLPICKPTSHAGIRVIHNMTKERASQRWGGAGQHTSAAMHASPGKAALPLVLLILLPLVVAVPAVVVGRRLPRRRRCRRRIPLRLLRLCRGGVLPPLLPGELLERPIGDVGALEVTRSCRAEGGARMAGALVDWEARTRHAGAQFPPFRAVRSAGTA